MKENKLNIIIDGQFGSTGKGLFAGYLAINNHYDIFCCDLSPNAGHTYKDRDGTCIIVKQLPVGALLRSNRRSMIYFTAGSIINPDILLNEIKKLWKIYYLGYDRSTRLKTFSGLFK